MATVLKVIGQTAVGAGPSEDLLTTTPVATGKALLVKNIRLVNTGTSLRKGTVRYLPGNSTSNERPMSPMNFTLAPGVMVVLDDEFVLVAGDGLKFYKGDAFSTGDVAVVVSGIERDQS